MAGLKPQGTPDEERCSSQAGDDRIAACTRVIDSGKHRGLDLASLNEIRGSLFAEKQDYDRAIEDFSQAIRSEPAYPVPFHTRGLVWAAKKDYDRALQDLDEAVRRARPPAPFDSKYLVVSYLASRCYVRSIANRDLQLALADCIESLLISPDDYYTMSARGLVYLRLDLLDEAIADYDAVLKIAPKRAPSLYGRGIAKLRKGNEASGNADIAAAKVIEPSVADRFTSWGVVPPVSAPPPSSSAPTPPASTQQQAVATPAADCADAAAHWQSAETLNMIEGYEDHLRRFPNCAFAGVAKLSIDKLRR